MKKIVLRFAERGDDDYRVEQCKVLGEVEDSIALECDGELERVDKNVLEVPRIFTYFSDNTFGDMALYILYTESEELKPEALQADFRRLLRQKFSFFYHRSLQ